MKMDWGSVYLSSIARFDPCKLSNPRMTIEQANQKQTYIYIYQTTCSVFCCLTELAQPTQKFSGFQGLYALVLPVTKDMCDLREPLRCQMQSL